MFNRSALLRLAQRRPSSPILTRDVGSCFDQQASHWRSFVCIAFPIIQPVQHIVHAKGLPAQFVHGNFIFLDLQAGLEVALIKAGGRPIITFKDPARLSEIMFQTNVNVRRLVKAKHGAKFFVVEITIFVRRLLWEKTPLTTLHRRVSHVYASNESHHVVQWGVAVLVLTMQACATGMELTLLPTPKGVSWCFLACVEWHLYETFWMLGHIWAYAMNALLSNTSETQWE